MPQYAADKLRRRGVEIRLKTGVKSATVTGVETDGGDIIDAETVIAAIGNAPSPLVRSLPVQLDRGKIVVDRCLRVQGLDDVWALGDNAHIPLGDPNEPNIAYAPPLAQFAVREAKILAQNILAHLKDGTPRPFEYRSLGTMASLGGRTGVADILGVRITGFFAWAAWRMFYLSLLPSMSTRVRVAVDWLLDLIVSRNIAEVRTTQSLSRHIRFLAGDLVVEPGVDPGGLYVVISGAFDHETPGPSGEGAPAGSRRLGPNDCFGLAVGGETGSDKERITAREDSTVYFVERSDLKRLAMVSALVKQPDEVKGSSRSDAGSEPNRGSQS